ncbi:hypothetical protein R1sor_015535 [Riccia sorocarpa]|uniref:Reverse transcriptase zinc-binding domain-containing protein n=1 Tax=Riccia sorocarpa TaxID=122646 RepID=A0ABD3HEG4_9MARC
MKGVSYSHHRSVWRMLSGGGPLKAHKWGKDASLCKRCALEEENESHLLWSCPKAKEVWFDFNFIAQGTEAEISTNQSFIAALDMALRATLPTKLLCIAAITKVIWQERNYITYQSYFKKIPLRATVQQILLVARVQMEKLDSSSRNYGQLKAATDTLARLEARLLNVAPQLSPVVPQEDSESSVMMVPMAPPIQTRDPPPTMKCNPVSTTV